MMYSFNELCVNKYNFLKNGELVHIFINLLLHITQLLLAINVRTAYWSKRFYSRQITP